MGESVRGEGRVGLRIANINYVQPPLWSDQSAPAHITQGISDKPETWCALGYNRANFPLLLPGKTCHGKRTVRRLRITKKPVFAVCVEEKRRIRSTLHPVYGPSFADHPLDRRYCIDNDSDRHVRASVCARCLWNTVLTAAAAVLPSVIQRETNRRNRDLRIQKYAVVYNDIHIYYIYIPYTGSRAGCCPFTSPVHASGAGVYVLPSHFSYYWTSKY